MELDEVYKRKMDTRDELLDNIMDVIVRIKESQDVFRRATRLVLKSCGGISENVRLYYVNCTIKKFGTDSEIVLISETVRNMIIIIIIPWA
jgi:hypothetical protein